MKNLLRSALFSTPLLVATLGACESSSTDVANLSVNPSNVDPTIFGGTTTSSYPFAVGLSVAGGICSGALIAPNLILTARHCVSALNTGQLINASSRFSGTYPVSQVRATLLPNMQSGNFRQVREILVPSNATAVGNDIALIILTSSVSAGEATPIVPVVQHAVFNTARYSRQMTAIGYGATSPGGGGSGVRRIRQQIPIHCIDGSRQDCSEVKDSEGNRAVAPTEFLAGEGVCQGDSGSSAYDQKNFDANTFFSLGVLSRGSEGSCDIAIYTRTDSHKDFIINGAKRAATLGGYPEPGWTAPEAQDPEDTPYSSPSPKNLGETCKSLSDCKSRVCLSSDRKTYYCSEKCGANGSCPTNYACSDGYCFKDAGATPGEEPTGEAPAEPPAGGDQGTVTETRTVGCQAAPSGAAGATSFATLGLAVALVLRRLARKRAA
jgi:secreted trypsin-like serine protease